MCPLVSSILTRSGIFQKVLVKSALPNLIKILHNGPGGGMILRHVSFFPAFSQSHGKPINPLKASGNYLYHLL
jgi:hypothetical protein